MKIMMIAGVLMAVLGIVALVYEGIPYTKNTDVLEVGPIKATTHENKTFPISPLVGGLLLAGGVGLILTSRKSG